MTITAPSVTCTARKSKPNMRGCRPDRAICSSRSISLSAVSIFKGLKSVGTPELAIIPIMMSPPEVLANDDMSGRNSP
jgi:hypothetical protein